MAPVAQYVFAETPGISGRFTAGRHECLPYSVSTTFSKQTCKHQFICQLGGKDVLCNYPRKWFGNGWPI